MAGEVQEMTVGNCCEKAATIYCQGFLVGAEAKPRVLMRGAFENVPLHFEAISETQEPSADDRGDDHSARWYSENEKNYDNKVK